MSTTPVTALIKRARRAPTHRIAVIDRQRTCVYTYGNLLEDSASLARNAAFATAIAQSLEHNHGLEIMSSATPRVCILAAGYEFVVAEWASWLSGAMVVPLCDSHPAAELNYSVETSSPVAVICSDGLAIKLKGLPAMKGVQVIELDGRRAVHRRAASESHPTVSTSRDEATSRATQLATDGISVQQWNAAHEFDSQGSQCDTLCTLRRGGFEDQGALMIFTSGTTSKPKGVVHTHASLNAMTIALVNAWQWSPRDVILYTLPLHHVHGVVNALQCALWAGASIDMRRGKFDARAVLASMYGASASQMDSHSSSSETTGDADTEPSNQNVHLKCSPSRFMAVPAMYHKLLQASTTLLGEDDAQQKTVRALPLIDEPAYHRLDVQCFSGSAPLPYTLGNQWFDRTGCRLLERYGMTEVGMALSNPYFPEHERTLGTVGWPLPGVLAAIVRDTDVETSDQVSSSASEKGKSSQPNSPHPCSTQGELLLSGAAVFNHYWRNADATRDAFIQGSELPYDSIGFVGTTEGGQRELQLDELRSARWFRTGDVVERRRDGYWCILGRASTDIIKVGGHKVSALEVETVLLDHDGVAETTVLGLPDSGLQVLRELLEAKCHSNDLSGLHCRGMGETVVAIAVRNNPAASSKFVLDFVSTKLAQYKCPRVLLWVDEIPRNAMGKVNKANLLELLLQGTCKWSFDQMTSR